jgi:hypothetical protein
LIFVGVTPGASPAQQGVDIAITSAQASRVPQDIARSSIVVLRAPRMQQGATEI